MARLDAFLQLGCAQGCSDTRLGGFLLQEAFLLYKEGEAKIE